MAMTVPEVPDQALPNVRIPVSATPETFGGGAGPEAVQNEQQKILGTAGELVVHEMIRADEAAVQGASAQLGEATTKLLYDPNEGVLSSQGINAIPAQDKAWERFRKTANDISGTLHGEYQQSAFNKYAQTLGQDFNRQSTAHVSREITKHDADTFKAFVKNTTDFGAINFADPITRSRSLQDLETTTAQYAHRNGMDSDQEKNLRSEVVSNFHEQTVDAMVMDPKFAKFAKPYYEANKDDIDLKTRESLEKTLAEGDMRYRAQSSVLDIIQKHPDSEAEALTAADKIDDADERDMARKMISTRFQQNRAAVRNDQDSLFMDLGKMVDEKGLTDPVDIRNSIPAPQWTSLREDQKMALLKRGGETVTSPTKWMDFREALKSGKAGKIPRADMETKYLPFFSPGDKKQAIDEWTAAKSGGPREKSYQTVAQMLDTNLVENGFVAARVKNRTSKQVEFMKEKSDDVNRAIEMEQASVNRPLKPEEIRAVVDNVTKQAIKERPTHWWASTPPMAYGLIPEDAKQAITAYARTLGKTPTRDQIEKAYVAYQKKDKKGVRSVFE